MQDLYRLAVCGAVGDEGGGGFAALLIRDTPRLGASDPGCCVLREFPPW